MAANTRLEVARVRQVMAEVLEPGDVRFDLADWLPTPVYAAARVLAGSTPANDIRLILRKIRAQRPDERAASRATRALSNIEVTLSDGRPYDQGYALAAQVRQQLPYPDTNFFPIEQLLQDLGIKIEQVSLEQRELDAAGCWAQEITPMIFVNSRGIHAHNRGGARMSLAHEFCHLLVDRERELPLVEALNGRGPRRAEARANAFAAELLFPRASAANYEWGTVDGASASLRRITSRFGVNRALAARQVLNSQLDLPADAEHYVRHVASGDSAAVPEGT